MKILRQSTAATVTIGPFLDATDGVTPETGLTVAVELSKNGAAFAAASTGTTAHLAEGFYDCDFDTTDTGTVGILCLKAIDSANHVPVWEYFQVVEEAVYDAFFASSAGMAVTLAASAVTTIRASQIVRTATAQAGGATSITLDASASATDDIYNRGVIVTVSGTGAGQSNLITDYVGSTKVATVATAWATNPSSDTVFEILPGGIETATLAQLQSECEDAIDAKLAAIANAVRGDFSFPKNTARTNFIFGMFDENGDVVSGITPTCTRSLDGGTFAACANAASEIATSSGTYKIDLDAADLNGDEVVFKATGTGAKPTVIVIYTSTPSS